MKNILSLNLRAWWAALKAIVVFTVIVVVYTFVMTGIGQLGMPDQANGSMITNADGEVVGSSLIGQNFTDADGNALPQYFQPRPSAAGDEGYDASASSGTNKGHKDKEYLKTIAQRRKEIAKREGVKPQDVPADATTASSSGLDPHISPEYANIQVKRVAKARGMSEEKLEQMVKDHTTGRGLGFLGDPAVNVVTLNNDLDKLD